MNELINQKREIVQPSQNDESDIITQFKKIIGSSIYPKYATDPEIIEELWRLSTKLTESSTLRILTTVLLCVTIY